MNFASDNWAGASAAVTRAMAELGPDPAAAYGNDPLTAEVTERFSDLFERDVAVHFVATGSAANSLSLSTFMKASGIVVCHRDSHIYADECGAPEFLGGGAKLLPLDGQDNKLTPAAVETALRSYNPGNLRGGRAVAVSISQLTETGAAYSVDEVAAIGAVTRAAGVGLHMDGARFANALVRLGVSPASVTWQAGVDVLSFGGTKNGCWCADAVLFFDPERAEGFDFVRARSGHRFSKARFVAAQFKAHLAGGHWLETAGHANARAERLAAGLQRSNRARLAWPADGNEVFMVMDRTRAAALLDRGALFYEWPAGGESLREPLGADEAVYRLVTSFVTEEADVDAFLDAIAAI